MVAERQTVAFDDLSDADLVTRWKLGNDQVLEVLLRRHRQDLYRFCRYLVGNPEEAEDICQESIVRAISRSDTLRTTSSFRTWLFHIARNLAIDSFRRGKRLTPLPDAELPLPSHEETPYERVARDEEYHTVVEAVSRLKQRHRHVLMLREVQGLSYAEIADRLDVSEAAVETLLFRARRRLREEYTRRDAPVAAIGLLDTLKGFISRLGGPLSGTAAPAKVVATALLLGSAVAVVPPLISHSVTTPTTDAATVARKISSTTTRSQVALLPHPAGIHLRHLHPVRRQHALAVIPPSHPAPGADHRSQGRRVPRSSVRRLTVAREGVTVHHPAQRWVRVKGSEASRHRRRAASAGLSVPGVTLSLPNTHHTSAFTQASARSIPPVHPAVSRTTAASVPADRGRQQPEHAAVTKPASPKAVAPVPVVTTRRSRARSALPVAVPTVVPPTVAVRTVRPVVVVPHPTVVPPDPVSVPTTVPAVPAPRVAVPTVTVKVPTVRPAVPTVKPPVPAVTPAIPPVKPAVPTVKPVAPSVRPALPTPHPTAPVRQPAVPPVKPPAPRVAPTVPAVPKP